MDDRMTTDLVMSALEDAYKAKRPKKGLIHHSDRVSQYASADYRKRLVKYRMKASMSRKGNCYDNACIESFHSLLKKEFVYYTRFKTKKQAYDGIYQYIEFFITASESMVLWATYRGFSLQLDSNEKQPNFIF
ncbi:DDE-type integrase/transposase/recombinase [Paenibacillus sp. FSL L8-0436]|uniref:DDE-type integrase/transposase/recombinase n=1 Tax=Paenibacillus sp. FSL L8-0436 TaxID=2954686 RepID=UPI003159607D